MKLQSEKKTLPGPSSFTTNDPGVLYPRALIAESIDSSLNSFYVHLSGGKIMITGLDVFLQAYRKPGLPSFFQKQPSAPSKCKYCKVFHAKEEEHCPFCFKIHHSMECSARINGECSEHQLAIYKRPCQFNAEYKRCQRLAKLDLTFCVPCEIRHDAQGWRYCLDAQLRRGLSQREKVIWGLRSGVYGESSRKMVRRRLLRSSSRKVA